MGKQMMPVGVDDFAMLRENDYYYIDKTGMIKELLETRGQVNLFTRPRRFGKSINMSMLRCFFEIGSDKRLFDGLNIAKEQDLCEKYMGQFPVISISLKQVNGNSYEDAKANVWNVISTEAKRLSFLLDSDRLDELDKNDLNELRNKQGLIDASLYQLSYLLYKHYGRKVIILIDEYDAPIQKAYEKDYYDEMVTLIRQLFGYAFKSNEALYFGVLTGCMRISKESIFSDLNNPTMYTLTDDICDEWFGFTDQEVQALLDNFGLTEYYDITKNWYDGYRIGNTDIYCPWDVINWCRQLLFSSDKLPRNYWANVSENGIVYTFVEKADATTKDDLEVLSRGGCVSKQLKFELTYKEIYSSIDNLWSILFTAGYLTVKGRNGDGTYQLAIPNKEVLEIFGEKVSAWFLTKVQGGLLDLYKVFDEEDAAGIEIQINECLKESVSFMDGGNTEEQKESFYHGLLLGLVKGRNCWIVKSNREAYTRTFTEGSGASSGGNGRADIILIDRVRESGIIIEVKHAAESSMLDAKAREGRNQIDDLDYDEYFLGYDISGIVKYGIAFNKRTCRVVK